MDIMIEGVGLTPLKIINGQMGLVLHGIKSSDTGFMGFGEAYFSTVNKEAVKGWKCHTKMWLNIIVPVGSIRFVLYDDRIGSSTMGSLFNITLGPAVNYRRLTVPPGLWMAFQGKGDFNLLMNFASIPHDPEEAKQLPLDNSYIPAISWI